MPLDAVMLAREPDFRIGSCVVRPSISQIAVGERCVRLEPRVMQVLVVLARRANAVVARDDIQHACWGDVVVGDDALNRCIQRLRACLRELDAIGPVIETVPRVGYSLTLPAGMQVEELARPSAPKPASEDHPPPAEAAPPPQPVAPLPPVLVQAPGRRWMLPAGTALVGAAVAIGVYFGFFAGEPVWTIQRVSPATTAPGREVFPALSPDGGQLVYGVRQPGRPRINLMVQSAAGGSPVQVTDGDWFDTGTSWAPDGARIAFTRSEQGTPCRILVQPVPSGAATEVGRCRTDLQSRVAWIDGGEALVFADRPSTRAPRQLYRLDLRDGTVTPLTRAFEGSWGHDRPAASPDGRFLAFVEMPAWSVEEVNILDLVDGTVRRITHDSAPIGWVDWLPDGSLVFTSARQGDYGLWTVRPGGAEEPRRLATGISELNRLSSARHLPRLAVESLERHASLYSVPLDGGEPTRLTSARALDLEASVRASDGAVAFLSNRSGAMEIWVRQPDGGEHRVTQLNGAFLSGVRWSPDGRTLAFASPRNGNFDIFTINADGSGLRRLTDAAAEDLAPEWSPDGKWLYFASRRQGNWAIWRLDTASDAPAERITDYGPMSVRISPDGAWIYFMRDEQRGIWRMPADGSGEARMVVPGASYESWRTWAVTADAVFHLDWGPNDLGRLVRAPLDGGPPRVVAEFQDILSSSGLALTPGGEALVISRLTTLEIDVRIMDLTLGR